MNSLRVEKSDITGNMNDLKLFLLCISSSAIGFGLIGILPYEIPLFLRVLIAFLFLGIPLLDPKKTVIFGIAGGMGFFIKDYIFWDLFSFKWNDNEIYIPLFSGIMIGTFLSVALWNRKAIKIFPLTGSLAYIFSFSILGAGIIFGAGMYLYLLSIKKIPSSLRNILKICGILLICILGVFMIIGNIVTMGHPPYVGNIVASVGEVVEKEGIKIAVTNYTFFQNNTGRVLKAGIMIQSPFDVNSLRLHLMYRQDEHIGYEITEIWGHLENIGSNTTTFSLSFENLPEHLRKKDFAVVWEIWTDRGIEYVIWRTN
ncbi:MAG: hypothetical protein OIN87_06850 [Candidatus Methanoperedens sp.]|nr:hypothetical protein [Candidatus Methanoperedens sp.]